MQNSGYSTFLEDLQRDSDDDVDSGKTMGLELPFQENTHFKKFAIMHRLVVLILRRCETRIGWS